ncbi:MAG: hypothetical protein FJZ60_00020 [Chlamydiae bacterium]|nr:hypothetical protein [Chlamydiota bacterium]
MSQESKKFKVKELTTGLYWDGTVQNFTGEPLFSKRGKTWTSFEKLKENFSMLEKLRTSISPLWEIVEYTKTPQTGVKYPASVLSSNKKI